MNIKKNIFLFKDVMFLKGVGLQTKKYLEKKKIDKIKDLLWDIPYSITDRSKITTLDNLEIGKIMTIKVYVKKYNFPRIRNLPNKVVCEQNKKKINIIFFNSFEGYVKKILPLGKLVIISGKINFYKNTYQITNPTYVKPYEDKEQITKVFPKYSLTEGLNETNYRKLIKNILDNIEDEFEWHSSEFLKKNSFNNFKTTFLNLHNPLKKNDIFSNDYRRLAYDEIFATLLTLFAATKITKINKIKKNLMIIFPSLLLKILNMN